MTNIYCYEKRGHLHNNRYLVRKEIDASVWKGNVEEEKKEC